MRMTEDQYHHHNDMMEGICLTCGAVRGCCEPDARHYPCEECEESNVFGVEELMLMGKITLID